MAVLQLGDSHTANDGFSGRMRELMQERFGDGGRGMLPPGIPYAYYRPAQVHVTADGFTIGRAPPLGFAALSQRAAGPASLSIEAEPPGLQQAEIEVLAQLGGGSLRLTPDDGPATTASTAGRGVLRIPVGSGAGTRRVQVDAVGDGPVELLGEQVGRAGPGLTWSNLGTIGATVELAQRWDPAILRAEARALDPALIVLAFGTNEGFKDGTDLAAYPALFRAALHKLRQAAPRAAILVLGPPGGVRATSGAGDCPDRAGWQVPPNLPRIRAIERRVAEAEGVAFWDWSEAMGGDCAIVAWAETDPPTAARDHVHLLKPGYRQTAEALFARLMQGYGGRAATGPR